MREQAQRIRGFTIMRYINLLLILILTHHAMHWRCIRGLTAQVDVWLKAAETEISAALWTSADP